MQNNHQIRIIIFKEASVTLSTNISENNSDKILIDLLVIDDFL